MAAHIKTGRSHSGSASFTVTGAAPIAMSDTLTIHGITLVVREWVRRGVLRLTSTSGNTATFIMQGEPESA